MGKAIVRTYSAGVFMGELDQASRSADGKRGVIKNARRLWYWSGAASLSQLATKGTSNPKGCKFPAVVDEIEVTEIIEVLPVTEKAAESIEAVPVWEV
jgi:hypothetical protein